MRRAIGPVLAVLLLVGTLFNAAQTRPVPSGWSRWDPSHEAVGVAYAGLLPGVFGGGGAPGVDITSTQTVTGAKTWSGAAVFNSTVDVNSTLTVVGGNEFAATNIKSYGLNTINIKGQPTDGASSISVRVYSNSTLSTAGASILAFYNDGAFANLKARVDKDGFFLTPAQTLTVANNAVGSSAATATLTPTSEYVNCTCNDPDGCTITMGETGVQDGTVVRIFSSTATACNFADTSGVSELAGAYAMGQYDALTLLYASDRWVEIARSNN